MAKDQSMRIPPKGGIRNVNVLSHIITLYVPSKMAKNHIMLFTLAPYQYQFQMTRAIPRKMDMMG